MIKEVFDAWQTLLTDAIEWEGTKLPVHRLSAPANTNDFFIQLKFEGTTPEITNSSRKQNVNIGINIVSVFDDQIGDEAFSSIFDQIDELVFQSVKSNYFNLSQQGGIYISGIKMTNSQPVMLADGSGKYRYAYLLRYTQLVTKTN